MCVLAGKQVWSVRIDLHILDNQGYAVYYIIFIKDLVVASPWWADDGSYVFLVLSFNRNLVDAANIATLAALLTFRRPECTLGGEDGQEVIVHPPEVIPCPSLCSYYIARVTS